MSKYYCHEEFKYGLTCAHRTSGGMCSGGWLCSCPHKSTTPKLRIPSPTFVPPPSVSTQERKSTKCSSCEHFDVCELKKKFKELKAKNYPLVCECEKYKAHNPLLEVWK